MKYWIILLFFWSFQTVAQLSSKLSIDLYLQLKETPVVDYTEKILPVLVKGDLQIIEQLVEKGGGQYKYGVKNIASVRISLATVEKLLSHPKIQRLEYREAVMHSLTYPEDTVMLTNNNVWDAHSGGGALPHGFQGQGVLLGVIDDGFEWEHPDFFYPDSSTRILYLWDQNSTNSIYHEAYYGYGATWAKTDIDNHQCTHVPGQHGSHVMGTAAGNAGASGKYLGIAPKADLACVSVARNATFLSGFVDGVHYLFSKADGMGQACSINSSVGSYSSGHDGKDLYSQLIDNMLLEKGGRALIQAGGNARAFPIHLGVALNNSTSKTQFKYYTSQEKVSFDLYADTVNFSNIDFSFQLVDPQNQQVIAQTSIYNVWRDFIFWGSIANISQVLFMDANNNPVVLEINIDQYEDAYQVAVRINSVSNLGHWQLTTTGTGAYDIWSDETLLGTSDILENVTVPNYTEPDNKQTIVGYWTCSDKVITVGSYQNRTEAVTWLGDTVSVGTIGYPQFGISGFSSLGPTRTGLQKPDITASGGQVMSASTLGALNYYKTITNNRLDQDGWHLFNRGTSMAAPMVTGAVALYFQCKPYANYATVLQALESSAKVDSFVFVESLALPNIHWGYGKLDVYELLESCLIYGCMDSVALNYNPLATYQDSMACFYTMTGLNTIDNKAHLSCQPNPFSTQTTIHYTLPTNNERNKGTLSIYNSLGQVILTTSLSQNQGTWTLNRGNLAAGAYWIVLKAKGEKYAHQQLIVQL
ncbi:MAG: S8 family peptidase [Aureispira sp.]|nr:S8 family peptidase [Aureispira sp.]